MYFLPYCLGEKAKALLWKTETLKHKRKEKICFPSKEKQIYFFMYALREVKTTRKKIIIPLSENRGNESLKSKPIQKGAQL